MRAKFVEYLIRKNTDIMLDYESLNNSDLLGYIDPSDYESPTFKEFEIKSSKPDFYKELNSIKKHDESTKGKKHSEISDYYLLEEKVNPCLFELKYSIVMPEDLFLSISISDFKIITDAGYGIYTITTDEPVLNVELRFEPDSIDAPLVYDIHDFIDSRSDKITQAISKDLKVRAALSNSDRKLMGAMACGLSVESQIHDN